MSEKAAVSEAFERAFDSAVSGCRRVCHCGRTHFDTANSWDWGEGELEGLEDMAQENPDRYMSQPNGIGSYAVCGREFVMGCPCNGGAGYEQFLLAHGPEIARYLNERAARLQAEAAATLIKTADANSSPAA